MCLTKKQIEALAQKIKLPYALDESNHNQRFERNFLRQSIIPELKSRWPGLLRHYVHRSNALARALNLARADSRIGRPQWHEFQDHFGGVGLLHPQLQNDFSQAEEAILAAIHRISTAERGTLRLQIKKMIEAAAKGRQGPLSFSGGVMGYIQHGVLYFIHQKNLEKFQQADQLLLQALQRLENTQIPDVGYSKAYHWFYSQCQKIEHKNPFPFFAVGLEADLEKILPGSGRAHPLWPLSSAYAVEQGLRLAPMPRLLYLWEKAGKKSHFFRFLFPQ